MLLLYNSFLIRFFFFLSQSFFHWLDIYQDKTYYWLSRTSHQHRLLNRISYYCLFSDLSYQNRPDLLLNFIKVEPVSAFNLSLAINVANFQKCSFMI